MRGESASSTAEADTISISKSNLPVCRQRRGKLHCCMHLQSWLNQQASICLSSYRLYTVSQTSCRHPADISSTYLSPDRSITPTRTTSTLQLPHFVSSSTRPRAQSVPRASPLPFLSLSPIHFRIPQYHHFRSRLNYFKALAFRCSNS